MWPQRCLFQLRLSSLFAGRCELEPCSRSADRGKACVPSLLRVVLSQAFVSRAVAPGATGLHLYTAPPKAVLQQPKVRPRSPPC